MEAYILVAYVFWGLAFSWAIYAMLVALGLARPLMNWITKYVRPGITKHVWPEITGPIQKYPILFAVLGYVGGLGLLVWIFHEPLGLFDNVAVTGWEDRRSLGLGFAGITAPLLAIIGFILSNRRTRELARQNTLQAEGQIKGSFVEALNALTNEQRYVRLAAIESMEKLGSQRDGEFYDVSIEALSGFCVGESNEKTKSTKLNVEPREIHRAFLAICRIEKIHAENSNYEDHPINLRKVNLSEFEMSNGLSVANLDLSFANLSSTNFRRACFRNVFLYKAIFKESDWTNARFDSNCRVLLSNHGNLKDWDISGVKFTDADIYVPTQSLIYMIIRPPIGLLSGMFLPTPYDQYSFASLSNRDAEKFWLQPGNDRYRPRDRDGNLIKII